MSKAKIGGISRSRKKLGLRKQGVPIRHDVRDVNPSVEEVAVDSSTENQDDDDVVVVSSTASRRRTRASVASLEKKRVTLGVDIVDSAEPVEAMDLEELEKLVEKKKAAKKGKGKTKRPSNEELKGEDVEGESVASLDRRNSKGKLKVNDDRNRINNRRIAQGVENVSYHQDPYMECSICMANQGTTASFFIESEV
ncbi:hypothetical protein LIER_25014 [Lithospermum erythrorhizon]|uniref:Uncharacterized protein n=1 Tax=Lithospermum erythrorhizon TaxID=34254 RepID=A0AAV3R4M5_LITER